MSITRAPWVMSAKELRHWCYSKGQGDLVSRLVTFMTHKVTLVILIINLLTKSPRPSK